MPSLLFENQPREALAGMGELSTPRIADLFIAKLSRPPALAALPAGALA